MNDCLSQFNKSDKQFCEIGNNWPINLTNNVFKIGQLWVICVLGNLCLQGVQIMNITCFKTHI